MAETLTPKQARFVEAYVGEAAFNGAKAARIAGYAEDRSDVTGSELLRLPLVRAAVDQRTAELSITSAEVLVRLTQIARNDAAAYIRDGGIDLDGMAADGKLHLVKGIKETKYGREIELFDPQAALGTLAKHHGLLRDQVEISMLGRLSKELDALSNDELLAIAESAAGGRVPPPPSSGEAGSEGS